MARVVLQHWILPLGWDYRVDHPTQLILFIVIKCRHRIIYFSF
jgi:hypothetical protein